MPHQNLFPLLLFLSIIIQCLLAAVVHNKKETLLIKVGGSSITNKAQHETLDPDALEWLVSRLSMKDGSHQHSRKTVVLVHGAGSFGHFSAKEYGLRGQVDPPPEMGGENIHHGTTNENGRLPPRLLEGLAVTRRSVQTLNQLIVTALVDDGVPAIGLSPCFNTPGLQAHGGDATAQGLLRTAVHETIQAGLLPVLHGDACLYGGSAGILGGDTVMEILGQALWVDRVLFLTDVDGVFTSDPHVDPSAELISLLPVTVNGTLVLEQSTQQSVDASGSTHAHDVTGGLQTKLSAAVSIASAGKVVTIAKHGSISAEQAIQGLSPNRATILQPYVDDDTCPEL